MATKATTLFSLATVKSHLKIKSVDTSQDATITRIADSVSEQVESYTNRVFVIRNIVERYDGKGNDRVYLRNFPVVAINSVKTRWTLFDSFIVVDPANYETDLMKGILYYRGVIGPNHQFPDAPYSIEIDGNYGFGAQDSTALPADVIGCGLDWVKFAYDRWNNGMITVSSGGDGGRSYSFLPKPPKDIFDALEGWRKVRV